MSKLSLHAASAPMFAVLLTNVGTWLDKAEAHAAAKQIDLNALLSARLAPDMFPLHMQIQFATMYVKNAMCLLAGETPPDFPNTDVTLAQLRARIARTLDIVASASPSAVDAGEDRPASFRFGPQDFATLPGTDYLLRYILPNFYFHVTTAYTILRANGVELGKQDFMQGAFEAPA